MHIIQVAAYVVGALMMLGILVGFFVSFWRPAPKRDAFSDQSSHLGTSYPTNDNRDSHY